MSFAVSCAWQLPVLLLLLLLHECMPGCCCYCRCEGKHPQAELTSLCD